MRRKPEKEWQHRIGSIVVKHSLYADHGKRLFDFSFSLLAILLLCPIFLILILMEFGFHGHPIFYTVKRPGKNLVLFTMRKFRSMTNQRDIDGQLMPENKRLTLFGKFLRRTSLDELPQLFSILRGDMAIIGPRPLMVEYLEHYSERHIMRHCVRPGLACIRIKRGKNDKIPSSWTWNDQFERAC